jgi:hypothetical protein
METQIMTTDIYDSLQLPFKENLQGVISYCISTLK